MSDMSLYGGRTTYLLFTWPENSKDIPVPTCYLYVIT